MTVYTCVSILEGEFPNRVGRRQGATVFGPSKRSPMARKRKARSVVPPTCNCIILCDDVVTSVGRNKHNLIGLINGINVPELPAVLGGFMAYVRGSNVHGEQTIRLTLEAADNEEEILGLEGQFTKETDPLSVYTVVLKLPPFKVEREGRYLFSAKHNGVAIAQMSLNIRLAPARGALP